MVAFALLSVLGVAPRARAQGTTFLKASTLLAGPYVVTGDFNNDGKLDLAVVGSRLDVLNTVTIYLGKGDGSFTPKGSFSSGNYPSSVAAGDFNGDGNLDLVVTAYDSREVHVFLGNGDGTFQPPATYGVGNSPTAVAVGDFNGDGKPDLAVTNGGTSNVSILLNSGTGTFLPAVNYAVGSEGSDPVSVAVGDFNGDGKPDLAVANAKEGGSVSVLLNDGNGTFQAAVNYMVGGVPTSVAAGDFNADGNLDLVVAGVAGPKDLFYVGVLLGDGSGGFRAPVSIATGFAPYFVAVADFNGDGKLDFAVANAGDGDVSIFLGKGDGSFEPPRSYAAGIVAPPATIAVGDLNGDGRPDMAVGGYPVSGGGLTAVTVLMATGGGAFNSARVFPAPQYPEAVAVGDFNGDGKLDLAATATRLNDSVSIFLGDGKGDLGPARRFRTGHSPSAVAAGDFNHDGKLDLAVTNSNDNNVSVLLGNGDGTFQTAIDYVVESAPAFVAVADVNNDGNLDLVVANSGSNTVSVLLGNGNGTFQPAASYSTDQDPVWVAVGDFNKDGKLDLAVANKTSNDVSILLGNGNGTFQPAVNYAVFQTLSSVVVADFNRDGNLDVAAVGSYVNILLGNGDGTFQPYYDLSNVGGYSATVTDVNGDGIPDIVLFDNGIDSFGVGVLLGIGNGYFQPASYYPVAAFVGPLAVGDFNGDGAPDVATGGVGDAVTILLNTRGISASTTSSLNPSAFGQPVTFTTTVSFTVAGSGREAGPITGTVTFMDGTTVLGTAPVSGGKASFTTSGLSVGPHTITAAYSGSSNYNPATSPPLIQQVNQAQRMKQRP